MLSDQESRSRTYSNQVNDFHRVYIHQLHFISMHLTKPQLQHNLWTRISGKLLPLQKQKTNKQVNSSYERNALLKYGLHCIHLLTQRIQTKKVMETVLISGLCASAGNTGGTKTTPNTGYVTIKRSNNESTFLYTALTWLI